MRPMHPLFRIAQAAKDSPIRTLVEAQVEARSASKRLRSDFEAADTWVKRTLDFPAGNSLTAVGNTTQVTLSPGGQSASGLYDVRYSVSITPIIPGAGTNDHHVTVAVEVDITGGGTWLWLCAFDYPVTKKVGEPGGAIVWPSERQIANITGLSTSSKLRLRISEASGPASWQFSVHGFNLATDADLFPGVQFHTGPGIALQDGGGAVLADTILTKASQGVSDGYETDLGGLPRVLGP